MKQKVLVILLEGESVKETPIAKHMRTIRDILAYQSLDRLKQCEGIQLVACTNQEAIINYCKEQNIPVYDSRNKFEYLPMIQYICKEEQRTFLYSGCLVLGGASLPLAETKHFQRLINDIQKRSNLVWVNNIISPDVVGWSPIEAIHQLANVETDNELAIAFYEQTMLASELWPRELVYTYDFDTPIDVFIAAQSKAISLPNDFFAHSFYEPIQHRVRQFWNVVTKSTFPSITLIGRVSPQTVQFYNQEVKAHVRFLSEERGMKGLKRDKEGKVWSLVADWIESIGWKRALEHLARESDAIVIDTRVWMAHHKYHLSDEERFASDLLLVDWIQHPALKEMTKAALDCSVPVLLGGFSLVNQGLPLLFSSSAFEENR